MAARETRINKRKPRPALTVEGRENQLASLAFDLAEKQLIDGSASAQVVSHFIKVGSTRETLEKERLRNENKLLHAKVEDMGSRKRIEELYETALHAMRQYSGQDPEPLELEEHYE